MSRDEPVAIPATLGVTTHFPSEVVLEFDAVTLVRHGMNPERASALVAAGKARIVGRILVRDWVSASSAQAGERLRFAIPGAAVVRALESGEPLRCWWPADGERRLWFESEAEGGALGYGPAYGQKRVTTHTPAQRSTELGLIVGGVLVGLVAIIVIAL